MKGVTSNPSIFEKAIGETDEYADALKQFQAQADHSISAIYEHLAIADIRAAADVLRPVYEQTQGRDGYISLECSPYLANDTEATVAEALRLWAAVERPNLMVKVPATPAGIPAIRQLIGRGLNINITLLFSVNVYEQVVEAYISGLEDLKKAGGDLSKIGSVASFFVSRIDTAVDKRLDKLGDKEAADELRGKAAIANAKLAYVRYKALFSRPALGASGSSRRQDATPALGFDQHQESDLQRHDVCGGARSVATPWTPSRRRRWMRSATTVRPRPMPSSRTYRAHVRCSRRWRSTASR